MQTIRTGFLFVMILLSQNILAQTKAEKEVSKAVEDFRKAMIDPDKETLNKLVSSDLSYGHSDGKLDDKQSFMENFLSGKYDFVTIDLSNQTVVVHGNTAIVRHILNADTNDSNIPGTVKLSVLTVWEKQNGQWKLLARQAVRPK